MVVLGKNGDLCLATGSLIAASKSAEHGMCPLVWHNACTASGHAPILCFAHM